MHMWGKFNGCYIGIARVWSSVVEEQHVSEWLENSTGWASTQSSAVVGFVQLAQSNMLWMVFCKYYRWQYM